MNEAAAKPSIILVSEDHTDFLVDEFGRYAATTSCTGEERPPPLTWPRIQATGGQVALFVSQSCCPTPRH